MTLAAMWEQGASGPPITGTLTDSSGNPVDLTGATVRFLMRPQTGSTPTTNAAATVTNATGGAVSYTPTPGDLATPGYYQATWQVTSSAGAVLSYPLEGLLDVYVKPGLAQGGAGQLVQMTAVKEFCRFSSTDTSLDAELYQIIRGVRAPIEAITGPIIQQQFDEWYDGGQTFIRLRHRPSTGFGTSPVLTVQMCSEYNGPIEWPLAVIGSPDEGQLYSVQVDVQLGRVVRRTAGGAVQAFPAMPQSVHVVYTAGQSQVPDNVHDAALEMIRLRVQETLQGPPQGSPAFQPDDQLGPQALAYLVTPRIRQMLAPTRRHPSLA